MLQGYLYIMLLGFVGAARVWFCGAQVLGDSPILDGFYFLLECNMFPDLLSPSLGLIPSPLFAGNLFVSLLNYGQPHRCLL